MGKVIFLALSGNGVGIWLRYTLNPTSAGLWLSIFGLNKPVGYRVNYPRNYFQLDRGYNLMLGNSRFSLKDSIALGESNAFSWNLRFESHEGIYNPIPLLFRVLRSKYLLLTPLATFNGKVFIMQKEIEVNNYKGMIGFISIPKELNEWGGWVHCSGFDEDEKGWLDLLITKVQNAYLGIGFIKVNGKTINIGRVFGKSFKGYLSIDGLRWIFKISKNNIKINVNADPRNMIMAEYEDPNGNKYCHNTEIANLVLNIDNKAFTCIGRAFFEYGTSKPLLNNKIIIVTTTPA